MKRSISAALTLLLVLSALLFAACGGGSSKANLSDSKYVGTWKASAMALKGESEDLGAEWTLTLNADGSGEYVDEEGTTTITWELTSGGFKTKGDTKLTFTDDGDNIKCKIIGVDMIWEKQ